MSVIESAKNIGYKALGILLAFHVTYNLEEQTFIAGLMYLQEFC